MCWSQIIGGAVQGGQSGLQGEQAATTLNANVDTLDKKAQDALDRGAVAEQTQRHKGDQILGTQRAIMGASGVDVNSGSSAAVQEQTAGMSEFDAQTIRTNALRESWGYKTAAEDARAQAENAMSMMDLIAPGGRNFQKKLNINAALTAGTGLELLGNAKAFKSFDNKRTAWGK